ncbi:MAG: class IV adenylate cyclase [Chloroflexi bacterium]|nr:class IV adenylate cyclase [Chloroflexota bacterium]
MSVETECKVHIQDPDGLKQRLTQAGAHISVTRVYEHNIRFEDAEHSLTARDAILRLRRDNQVRLAYKGPAGDRIEGVSHRLELETTVGDLETVDAILRHLGFVPYMVYEKYRTTYRFDDLAGVELVLDEMPFGNFIEVEGAPDLIDVVLARLDLADAHRIVVSYVELFERILRHYQLDFGDLTFANFAGIQVDPIAFMAT